jgi:hypothetical protein
MGCIVRGVIAARELSLRRNPSLGICTNSLPQTWTVICFASSTTSPGSFQITEDEWMTLTGSKRLEAKDDLAAA